MPTSLCKTFERNPPLNYGFWYTAVVFSYLKWTLNNAEAVILVWKAPGIIYVTKSLMRSLDVSEDGERAENLYLFIGNMVINQ